MKELKEAQDNADDAENPSLVLHPPTSLVVCLPTASSPACIVNPAHIHNGKIPLSAEDKAAFTTVYAEIDVFTNLGGKNFITVEPHEDLLLWLTPKPLLICGDCEKVCFERPLSQDLYNYHKTGFCQKSKKRLIKCEGFKVADERSLFVVLDRPVAKRAKVVTSTPPPVPMEKPPQPPEAAPQFTEHERGDEADAKEPEEEEEEPQEQEDKIIDDKLIDPSMYPASFIRIGNTIFIHKSTRLILSVTRDKTRIYAQDPTRPEFNKHLFKRFKGKVTNDWLSPLYLCFEVSERKNVALLEINAELLTVFEAKQVAYCRSCKSFCATWPSHGLKRNSLPLRSHLKTCKRSKWPFEPTYAFVAKRNKAVVFYVLVDSEGQPVGIEEIEEAKKKQFAIINAPGYKPPNAGPVKFPMSGWTSEPSTEQCSPGIPGFEEVGPMLLFDIEAGLLFSQPHDAEQASDDLYLVSPSMMCQLTEDHFYPQFRHFASPSFQWPQCYNDLSNISSGRNYSLVDTIDSAINTKALRSLVMCGSCRKRTFVDDSGGPGSYLAHLSASPTCQQSQKIKCQGVMISGTPSTFLVSKDENTDPILPPLGIFSNTSPSRPSVDTLYTSDDPPTSPIQYEVSGTSDPSMNYFLMSNELYPHLFTLDDIPVDTANVVPMDMGTLDTSETNLENLELVAQITSGLLN